MLCLAGLACVTVFMVPHAQGTQDASATNDSTAVETIQLGETTYPVPPPWAGNRLHTPSLAIDDFAMIPREHTRDGMQLYILKHAHPALINMLTAAREDGVELQVESGYRSPGYQRKIFLRMLDEGRTFDDIIRYVAPPGYSEHGLGIAVDFFPSNWEFANTAAYRWLAENASRYGFTESYPHANALHYPWEAWHWAYRAKEAGPMEMSGGGQTTKAPRG